MWFCIMMRTPCVCANCASPAPEVGSFLPLLMKTRLCLQNMIKPICQVWNHPWQHHTWFNQNKFRDWRTLMFQTWTRRKTHALVGVAWLLSLLFSFPQIEIFGYRELPSQPGVFDCWAIFRFDWSVQVKLEATPKVWIPCGYICGK